MTKMAPEVKVIHMNTEFEVFKAAITENGNKTIITKTIKINLSFLAADNKRLYGFFLLRICFVALAP